MYTVIGSDGNSYGPADIPTLRNWCLEGRLTPDTSLIDTTTGRTMRASDVQGLFDGLQPPLPTAASVAPPNSGAFGNAYHPGMSNPQQMGPAHNPYLQPLGTPRTGALMRGSHVGQKSIVAAAILALLLGWLGIHRFYLGHTRTGAIMLLLWMSRWILFRVGGMLGWMSFSSAMTFGSFVDAANFARLLVIIWALIDFVLILTGRLKDAQGCDLA